LSAPQAEAHTNVSDTGVVSMQAVVLQVNAKMRVTVVVEVDKGIGQDEAMVAALEAPCTKSELKVEA